MYKLILGMLLSITVSACGGGGGTTSSPPTAPIGVTTNFNDTGITASQCYQAASDVLVVCSSAEAMALNNAQDGMAGRDAYALTNSSADGKLGFSFASVNGGCVQDNISGLMWEVKTTDNGLRDWRITYTNYSVAYNPSNLYGAVTDVSGFVTAINSSNLCGYSDWRLPTVDELQSIVDFSVFAPGPTVDTIWFPNTQGLTGLFWSATPNRNSPTSAWVVNFSSGEYAASSRDIPHFVRLVRGGQPQLQPRYSVSANGQEVTDNQTKLIWRRCAEGMVFSGGTCTGTASTFTHEAALQQSIAQTQSTGITWRVPNVKELASIQDGAQGMPSIDPTAFPATPLQAIFWSASPYVGDSRYAWVVDFRDTGVFSGSRSNAYYVRLVRAGQ
jgi:hypothetical protein